MKIKTFFSGLILAALCMAMAECADASRDIWSWDDPVIPVSLAGIETVNIDNSGEYAFVSNSPIKKEAYMIGIQWITTNIPTSGDKFITGPIQKGEQVHSLLGDQYSKAIRCNTPFNAGIPAGEYVSKYFKAIDRNYLPADIDEGFALLVAPTPGFHSFRVEYYAGGVLKFFQDTPIIQFY